jgi:large exoprotein involved in heme utilization and adhesion
VPTNLISQGIKIKSESLQLSGENRQPFISNILTEAIDTETSGTIKINTNYLKIEQGSAIGSRAYGAGNGSDVFISSKFTEITGVSLLDPSFVSGLIATTTSSGNAGNILIETDTLQISQGGFIVSTTFGQGQGGNVRVNATRVEIIGVNELTEIPSAIAANTINEGDAGNLIINTSQLAIKKGGRIDSSTLGSGNGGNILISADETLEISGIDPKSNQRSSIFSTADFVEPVEQVFNLSASLSGNSGNIIVNANDLNIKDGGVISVENQGNGNGGNINLSAEKTVLDQGSISAETFSGRGGNISLQGDALLLQNQSKITASAENQGDGGNINLNSDLLLVWENSQITANAFQGNGGNIEINGNVLIDSESIISASSELGIDGQVQINGDIYEINDLTSKPTQFAEEQLITQGCFDGQSESAIQILQRGLGGRSLTGQVSYSFIPFSDPEIAAIAKKTASNPIVDATRMVVMDDGTVHLLASEETVDECRI